ncbi:MAG: AAA family ATPase [Oleiphilaceae bacterium]|nr:AAA family ATPase [Oleiphilaceae bacterium]
MTNGQKQPRVPRTLAVTGGKGGVGKTQVALNLALVLASQGKRTLLLDGDTELANVNIMLGLYPEVTLEHVMLGERSLQQAVLPVTANLDLLPGASGVPGLLNQPAARGESFLRELAALETGYDQLIIDTAAGIHGPVLHMVAASHLACVVITPDPTSLTDAFSLLKLLHRRGYRRTPSIIVNMAQGASQAQSIYRRFAAAVKRYIGLPTHYMGAIWRDESIAQSVTSQRPVAMMPPSDPSCRQFWSLADMLSVRWSQGVPQARGYAGYWQNQLSRQERRREEAGSTETPSPQAAPRGDEDWLQAFAQWLGDPQRGALERYRRLTEMFSALGRHLDADMLETLQTALAALPWDQAPVRLRNAAAAHFRQLARTLDPPTGAVPAEMRALSSSAAYDRQSLGDQQALVDYLQRQGPGTTLQQALEKRREHFGQPRHGTEAGPGSAGGVGGLSESPEPARGTAVNPRPGNTDLSHGYRVKEKTDS